MSGTDRAPRWLRRHDFKVLYYDESRDGAHPEGGLIVSGRLTGRNTLIRKTFNTGATLKILSARAVGG